MQAQDLPDPSPVIHLIDAFRHSKTMFAAVSLGVFDLLEERPATLDRLSDLLASANRVDRGALERLLDACVGLGLLRKEASAYANSPVAQAYLCRNSPHTLAGYILYSNRALYPLWGDLESAVRAGTSRWQQTFGFEGNIFDHFYQTDTAKREFLLGMHGFGMLSSPHVVSAFDLSRFHCLVDVGGGTGHLAITACERYPTMNAVVFDLPHVLDITRDYVSRSPAANRIAFAPGDFFRDPLPAADLYSLGRILHDWSEPKVRALLQRIFERLPPEGALLIAEKLLDADKSGPLSALMQSLSMLVCTEGKERTLAEYTSLLNDVGFKEVQGRKTGAPLDAILALKGAPS